MILDVDHDDLNKDNINQIDHLEAQLVAVRQTKHEWCRLLNVAFNEFDHRTASVPMGLWVEPGEYPHLAGTECAEEPPGNIDVTVSIDRVKVLNDHNTDGPGDLNFAFTLYTGDFRRSTRTQLPPLTVNTGAQVPGGDLPAPLSLCVDSTDQIVATLKDGRMMVCRENSVKDDDVLGGI